MPKIKKETRRRRVAPTTEAALGKYMDPDLDKANDIANNVVTNISRYFTQGDGPKRIRGFKFRKGMCSDDKTLFVDTDEFNKVDWETNPMTLLFIYVIGGGAHCVLIIKKEQGYFIIDPNGIESDYTFVYIKTLPLNLEQITENAIKKQLLIKKPKSVSVLTFASLVGVAGLFFGKKIINRFIKSKDSCKMEPVLAASSHQEQVITIYLKLNGPYPKNTLGICLLISLYFYDILKMYVSTKPLTQEMIIKTIKDWLLATVKDNERFIFEIQQKFNGNQGSDFSLAFVKFITSGITYNMHKYATMRPPGLPSLTRSLSYDPGSPAPNPSEDAAPKPLKRNKSYPYGGGKTKRKRKRKRKQKRKRKTKRKY